MAINKNENPTAYLNYLRDNKSEQDILFQDLLIPVTSFFRDSVIFDHLSETVFPLIVKNKKPGEGIRVWVAGCSTGEEAYSVAMGFRGLVEDKHRVQIFATDLSEPAIAKARSGIYSKREVEAVPAHHLQEFFTKTNGNYLVNKNIRDMCVFAVHNLLKDPPFGKMDFISCRNVLIYFEPYLQRKALTTFHYSLNPNGFLLLGKTETISGVPDLFTPLNGNKKSDKIFSRKDVPGKFMHVASQRSEQNLSPVEMNLNPETSRTDFQKTADEIMLRKYTPAGVVVNESMDIVHFRGKTSNYLEQSAGKPSHNLLQMAKYGLAFELRNVLHKAKKRKTAAIKENIPLQINGKLHAISIEALPLPNTIEPHYLILFHDNKEVMDQMLEDGKKKSTSKTGKAKSANTDLRIQQLEQELEQTREDMRSITEDQEAANEELQSANEELLSSSEELQSLNEELETGKEELQSTNEELMVVNHEITSLNEQVTEARDYAEAIVSNIREPLLVIDKNLRVRTANNAFYKTFRVHEKETEGVLIYDLGNKQWDIPALRTLLEQILPAKSKFNDFEVTHHFSSIGERVMLLNAREVINKSNSEKLILLSIEDITERKKAEEVIRKSEEQFRQLVKGLPAAVYSCDAEGRIVFYNDAAVKLWGRKPEVGKDLWHSVFQMFNPDGTPIPIESNPITITLKEGRPVHSAEVVIERPDGGRSILLAYPQPEFRLSGEIKGAINMLIDVTDQVLARKKVEESEHRYRTLIEEASVATALYEGPDLIVQYANDIMLSYWGKDKSVIGKKLIEGVPELQGQPFISVLKKVYTSGESYTGIEEKANLSVNNKLETYYFNFTYKALRDKDGVIYGIHHMAIDVTSQVFAKKGLEESERKFRQMAELMPQKISSADATGKIFYYNKSWLDYTGLSLDELIAAGREKFIHPDDLTEAMKWWQKSLETGDTFEREVRILNKNGDYKWHLTRATSVTDETGKIINWISAATEIQGQVEQREILEKSVVNRTHELLSANEELKRINKELEAFAYVSSHDLQEPLRKILTFSGRILENENKKLSDKSKRDFNIMKDAAVRMQTLIDDLLSFSRISTADRKYERTDLQIIIDKVKEEFKDTIEEKQAIIEARELCTVNVIRFQFYQLLQNLIGNALKFSRPDQPPHIIIRSVILKGSTLKKEKFTLQDEMIEKIIPDEDYCHITITDNGIGFENEFKEKIFEVFQKLHSKDEYAGTGIGLAIVKKIVDNHHGFITATSNLNKGTAFDIYMPVQKKRDSYGKRIS
jgi:two-component system CheB/CheR fusion protein